MERSFLKDSGLILILLPLRVDGLLAYPATQDGWDPGLVWGSAIPESPFPHQRVQSTGASFNTGGVPVHTSTKHTVSILEITFHTAEQVR